MLQSLKDDSTKLLNVEFPFQIDSPYEKDFKSIPYNNDNIEGICSLKIDEINWGVADKKATNISLIANLIKLDKYSAYQSNWDGEGAKPFDKKLIDKAKGILLELKYQPEIFPSQYNSIQFEYEKENGEYLEFELFQNKIVYFYINKDGKEEEDLNIIQEKMINKINAFYV